MKGFNLVDFLIILILGYYLFIGLYKGFLREGVDLLGLVLSFLSAFRFYGVLGRYLATHLPLSYNFSKALAFLLILFTIEFVYVLIAWFFYYKIPLRVRASRINKILGFIPSIGKGIIEVSVAVTLLVSFPLSQGMKKNILDSRIGQSLVKKTDAFEKSFESIFGGAINETLTFLTVKPQDHEVVALNFTPSQLIIDENSEWEMLNLVNRERTKVGLNVLTMDFKLRDVARAHSLDMFKRNYFSHETPEGLSPFDRLDKAGIEYRAAGENLALAPSVELAHQGLMNSPGHKANILSPDFNKIGIGTVDGGLYGKMFSQEFTN